MDTTAKFNTPPPIAKDGQWRTEPPTQPGTYWMRRDPPSRDIMMVQVRETNGELTVWWPDKDQRVTTLRASWRGPIPPSTGPGSR